MRVGVGRKARLPSGRGFRRVARCWGELTPPQRFAALQQVGSVLRASSTTTSIADCLDPASPLPRRRSGTDRHNDGPCDWRRGVPSTIHRPSPTIRREPRERSLPVQSASRVLRRIPIPRAEVRNRRAMDCNHGSHVRPQRCAASSSSTAGVADLSKSAAVRSLRRYLRSCVVF
jgi:hypothetical protein